MKARSYVILGVLALGLLVIGAVFLAERLLRPAPPQAVEQTLPDEQPQPAEQAQPTEQAQLAEQAQPAEEAHAEQKPAQTVVTPHATPAEEAPRQTAEQAQPTVESPAVAQAAEAAPAETQKPETRLQELFLSFASPAARSTYGSTVRVTGRTSGGASLSWSVDATDLKGECAADADGAFSFTFPTVGLKGSLVVAVKARNAAGKSVQASLPLVDRATGPALVVESPKDKATYGEEVVVTGRVGDPKDPSGTPAEVKSLSWRVVGVAGLVGDAEPRENGAFRFTVATKGLTGALVLELAAVDLNGRTTTRAVKLAPPETAEAAEGAPGGPTITVTSPVDGGYFKDITVVEGRVANKGLKSFTYEVSGGTTLSGKIVAGENGAFKVPLMLTAVTGEATIVLVSEDNEGRQNRVVLTLRDGRLKPGILLTAPPLKDGVYGTLLRVAGSVTDPYAGTSGMEGIDSLSWLLSSVEFSRTASPTRGTAKLGAGGAFRFTVPTGGLSGAQNLVLTATAKNGNKAETTVRLGQGEGDVASFKVLPADRTVTVSWDSLPFASRYDLYWAPGGAPPEKGQVRSGVSSPVTLNGLENGTVYSLQVRVYFDDGQNGASTVTKVIPLSPQSLAPVVKGDYMKIRLSWNRVTGATGYDVWRSLAGADAYTRVAEALSVSTYVDSSVEYGREYAYQISPAGILAPRSASVRGKSQAFPADKIARLGSVAQAQARGLEVSGGYAYVASGAKGIQIVDVSAPEKPVVTGSFGTNGAWDVAVRADYAYVADGEAGLQVLDISAPNAPVLLGTRKTMDARAVVLYDTYAFVADGDKGLKVIDVSDVLALNRVASVDTTNSVSLLLVGSLLYVADGAGGLKILNVKKPTAPAVLGACALTDARCVTVEGTMALVADGAGGLRVVDVANPAKPALVSTFPMSMAASVAYNEGYAYVADGATGVTVVDLKNPATPRLFTTFAAAGASCVRVVGRMLYIVNDAGLDVARIQVTGRSFRVASCETGGKAFSVTVAGNWAYVAGHVQGVQVVNVAEPGSVNDASLVGTLATRFATRIGILDKLAFVADGPNGMKIIDVSPAWLKPAAVPVEVGSYRPGGNVNSVVAAGTTVYIAAGEQGVHVVDAGTLSALKEVGSVRTANAQDVVLRGSTLFVADGDAGLKVIDVSAPAKPAVLPGGVNMNAKCLALSGKLLLVGGSKGVFTVDVTEPASPRLLGHYEAGQVEALSVNGRYAYVAEGFRGLTVLDVSTPDNPLVVSSCTDVYAVGVAAKGNYALVADSFGLRVIQILIPEWLLAKR